eukprot:4698028-Alexandrium_andersonii.AAC.1
MVAAETGRTGRSREDVEARVVVDRRPCPAPQPGAPLLCPYVYNGNFVCCGQGEAAAALAALQAEMQRRGLSFR